MATRTPKTKSSDPKVEKVAKSAAPLPDTAPTEARDTAPVPQLKFKDIVEQIVDRTGQRKGEVRNALQAALAVMGEALADGNELNLQPMGKMSVNRTKQTPRGQVLMVKMVQNTKSAADTSEDDAKAAEAPVG